MTSKPKTASTYLVVEARRSRYGPTDPETGLRGIDSVHVVAQRANRPSKLLTDQIAVKVKIQVPDSAFNPVMPVATVVVPEDITLRGPIEVEAEDANDQEG